MKKIIYQYISSTCVVFTFVMFFASLINGFNPNLDQVNKWLWMTILLFLLVVCVIQVINFCISRWDFKSNKTYHLVNFISTYMSSLFIFYLTNTMSFSLKSLIMYTFVYIIVYILLYYYFNQKYKL